MKRNKTLRKVYIYLANVLLFIGFVGFLVFCLALGYDFRPEIGATGLVSCILGIGIGWGMLENKDSNEPVIPGGSPEDGWF